MIQLRNNQFRTSTMQSSDPSSRPHCRKLGWVFFFRKRGKTCFSKKSPTSQSSFFHFSEVAFSTSEKLCPAPFPSSTLSLLSRLPFLSRNVLPKKIRLLNGKIQIVIEHITIQHTSNNDQAEGQVHLHHCPHPSPHQVLPRLAAPGPNIDPTLWKRIGPEG